MTQTKSVLLIGIIVVLTVVTCAAQPLPTKILGYKVHAAKVAVTTTASFEPAADIDVLIRLREMTVSHIGLLGATVNIDAEITSTQRSGSVDRLIFRDFSINDIAVDIDDLERQFSFRRGKIFLLRERVHARLSPLNAVKAGFAEITDTRKDWAISGTVFAFGRFTWFGFTFKRVIPVHVALAVRNPLL